ncbi:MAG: hypothetical protein WBX25_08130 [Rhodomicrobium sp.]
MKSAIALALGLGLFASTAAYAAPALQAPATQAPGDQAAQLTQKVQDWDDWRYDQPRPWRRHGYRFYGNPYYGYGYGPDWNFRYRYGPYRDNPDFDFYFGW